MMPCVLRLRGSPEAMGRQHGHLLKGEIHQRLQAAWRWWQRRADESSRRQHLSWLRCVHSMVSAFQRWGGPAWEEWQALARAAQVSPDELMLLTAWHDWPEVWQARPAQAVAGGCTAAVLRAPAVELGVWLALNWDTPPELGRQMHVFYREPDDGPRALVVAPAGGFPIAGINEAGLGFVWVDRACREAQPRLPTGAVFTDLAHLTHFDAALQALRETPRASGLAVALAETSSHATVLELAAERCAEHSVTHQHPLRVFANHYQSALLQNLDAWPNRSASEGRETRLSELLENARGLSCPSQVQRQFADHKPVAGETICQHPPAEQQTAAFIAVLCAARELAYTLGPPCQQTLVRQSLL
ncbi:MAG: C45 family peptidase [Gemmatales bacterium]|nr:C45 family peptidase [Gemmatales bacterium]MDW7995073.1 C45 family peptidase [Gemmatales bacterium]